MGLPLYGTRLYPFEGIWQRYQISAPARYLFALKTLIYLLVHMRIRHRDLFFAQFEVTCVKYGEWADGEHRKIYFAFSFCLDMVS